MAGDVPAWGFGFEATADMWPATVVLDSNAVAETDLILWFVEHGWRQSKSELVAKLLADFVVTRRIAP